MQFFLSSTAQTFSLVIICCFWKKLKSMQYNKQAELDFFLSGGLYEHGDNAYRFVFQQSLFRQNKSILTAGQEEGEGTGCAFVPVAMQMGLEYYDKLFLFSPIAPMPVLLQRHYQRPETEEELQYEPVFHQEVTAEFLAILIVRSLLLHPTFLSFPSP